MFKLHDWIDINKINWVYHIINAIELLKKNKNNGSLLSTNPNAILLLKENQDKINGNYLSLNTNAMELLKENQDKINWCEFSKNSNIFTYDYIKIKENMKNSGISEELIAFIFNPKNIDKIGIFRTSRNVEIYE